VPDHPVCIYCRQAIRKETDDYVIVNRDPDRFDTPGSYAHRGCHESARQS
jgi:hypothetical protein